MAANISFYNTSSKTIEAFMPYEEAKVTLYTCGPTVYDFAHMFQIKLHSAPMPKGIRIMLWLTRFATSLWPRGFY